MNLVVPEGLERPEIEVFIERFKENYPKELEYAFTHGNCYFFALILKHIYPEGHIYYHWSDHFVFSFNNKLYDITGEVTEKYLDGRLIVPWEELQEFDPSVYYRIIRDVIYHHDPILPGEREE